MLFDIFYIITNTSNLTFNCKNNQNISLVDVYLYAGIYIEGVQDLNYVTYCYKEAIAF